MNFLTDQDVYKLTINFLKKLGHQVIAAKEAKLDRATDEEVLSYAKRKKLILITRDTDFGALVFLKFKKHSGVILLRINPFLVDLAHKELQSVLKEHKKKDFVNSFVVIEPGRHRIRKLD